MANIVIYNPNGVVVNMVENYLCSVNTPDYESNPNILINPDVSGLILNTQYWKVDSTSVIEMDENEKNTVDNFYKAKTIRKKKYKVNTYLTNGQIDKEVWYFTDNGDGTYSNRVEKTNYTYNGIILLSKTTKVFYRDGKEASSVTIDYFKNSDNEYIEKEV